MTERTHEELKSLIAAHALGAVPEQEVPEIRAHLLTCEECMAEADAYAAVAANLALSVPAVSPPEGFGDRVMARVRDARTESPTRSDYSWWRHRVAGVVVAAAALLTGILGAVALDARNDLQLERQVNAALLRSDGFKLRGEGVVAAVAPSESGSILVVEGLQDAPESRTYQLWFLGDDRPVSAGVFDVENGRAVLEIQIEVEGYTGAAVTIEPAGGSDQPTTDPVITS